jgi:hypothetical protein
MTLPKENNQKTKAGTPGSGGSNATNGSYATNGSNTPNRIGTAPQLCRTTTLLLYSEDFFKALGYNTKDTNLHARRVLGPV